MTAGGPPRGIDPKAREVAEALARQSGLSLSEWLTEFLDEEAPEDAVSQDFFNASARGANPESPNTMANGPDRFGAPDPSADDVSRITEALDRLSARIEAAERRSAAAISGVDQTVRSVIQRLDGAEREQSAVSARFAGAVHEVRHEQGRMAERLRGIEAQANGPRSAEALRSLEAALGKVAVQLHEGEGRADAAIADVRTRLDHFEAERGEPGKMVDAVVSRLGARLEDAENRTSGALRELQATFATLDSRLHSVEGAGAPGIEARLEQLAATLSSRVDAARAEMAQGMAATADTRFDRMERALSEMSEHVRTAETRSTEAIERMGRDVVAIAETLGRRVQGVEHRSAEAIEQVGGDVARIAQVVETRLGRADSVHAQALEKLGGEIARITERLSERIGNSERRAAQAIDDVGEQVARVTERISQRQERATSELGDRIQQSEERTAKLLDEARETLEKLAATGRVIEAPRPADHLAIDIPRDLAVGPDRAMFAEDPYPGFEATPAVVEAGFAGRPYRQALGARFAGVEAYAPEPLTPWRPRRPAPLTFDQEEFDTAHDLGAGDPALDKRDEEMFARDEAWALSDVELEPEPAFTNDELEAEPEAQFTLAAEAGAEVEPFFEADDDLGEPSLAEVLAAARAEAAVETEAADFSAAYALQDDEESDIEPQVERDIEAARPVTTREMLSRARAAALASGGHGQSAGRRQSETPTLFARRAGRVDKRGVSKGAVAMTLTAAASIGVAFVGFTMIQAGPQARLPRSVENAFALAGAKVGGADTAAKPVTAGPPQVAMAMAITPISSTAGAAPAEDLATAYSAAVVKVETKDGGGVDALRHVASLGYAPAQFYLGKLYEDGAGGLAKNPLEARRWYERAAEAGERKAMHNLAMLYYYGVGGAKNSTTAGQWFRRAADLGLVDSQYNLGQLYELGFGVSQNPAEAYKWYLIAARSGDADSKASAGRVRDILTADARAAAERAAWAFRSGAPVPLAAPPPTLALNELVTAQKALSTLGYYQGPTDGVSSPALRLAIAAYQRDQGLPASGAADATTVTKLASLGR